MKSMKHLGKAAVLIALAICLGALPLAACSSSSGSASSSPAASDAAGSASAQAGIDVSGWKTLGDALADQTGLLASSNDDNYFMIVYNIGESTIRAVAKMKPGVADKLVDLDFFNPDDAEKIVKAIGGLELVSAEDISGGLLSQDDVNAYVGKTGQDLLDDGFAFESYYMYGGDETGAEMSRDYFSYTFTFDVHVDENATEDGGEAIKDATITDAQAMGNIANDALDLSFVN